MTLLTSDILARLCANADATRAAQAEGLDEPDRLLVVKLFNPLGPATWIATELDANGDTLFGLADLGFGCFELGSFSLRAIAGARLPFGLAIECDLGFEPLAPLSHWAAAARREGSMARAERALAGAFNPSSPGLPTGPIGDGG